MVRPVCICFVAENYLARLVTLLWSDSRTPVPMASSAVIPVVCFAGKVYWDPKERNTRCGFWREHPECSTLALPRIARILSGLDAGRNDGARDSLLVPRTSGRSFAQRHSLSATLPVAFFENRGRRRPR